MDSAEPARAHSFGAPWANGAEEALAVQQGQADQQWWPRASARIALRAFLSCCTVVAALAVCILPRPALAVEWETYLSEDFDSDSPMFYTGQAGEAQYSVDSDGRYVVDGMETGSDSLSALTDNLYYYYLEANCEVLQSDAGDLAFCGLVFHYHKIEGGKLAYYVFYTYGDGYYGAKRVLGEQVDIILPLTKSSEISPGQPNILAVDAQGSRFDLYINGKYVDGFTDTRVDGGGFGFYTSKHSKSAFDEFLVKVEKRGSGKMDNELPGSVEGEGGAPEAKDYFNGYHPPQIPKDPERPLYPWEVGYDKSRKGKQKKQKAEETKPVEGPGVAPEDEPKAPAQKAETKKSEPKKSGAKKPEPKKEPKTAPADEGGSKQPAKPKDSPPKEKPKDGGKSGKAIAPAGQPKGIARPPAGKPGDTKDEEPENETSPEADIENELPSGEEVVHEPSEHGKGKQARPPKASDQTASGTESGAESETADNSESGDLALLPSEAAAREPAAETAAEDVQSGSGEEAAAEGTGADPADTSGTAEGAGAEPEAESPPEAGSPGSQADADTSTKGAGENPEAVEAEPVKAAPADSAPAEAGETQQARPPSAEEQAAEVAHSFKAEPTESDSKEGKSSAETTDELPAREASGVKSSKDDKSSTEDESGKDTAAADQSAADTKPRKGLKIGGDDWDEPRIAVQRKPEPAKAAPDKDQPQATEDAADAAEAGQPAQTSPDPKADAQPEPPRGLPRDVTADTAKQARPGEDAPLEPEATPPDEAGSGTAQARPPEEAAAESTNAGDEGSAGNAAPADPATEAAAPAEGSIEPEPQPQYSEPMVDETKVQGGAYFGGGADTPLSEILPMLPSEPAATDNSLSALIHEDGSTALEAETESKAGSSAAEDSAETGSALPAAEEAGFYSSPQLATINDDFSTERWPVSQSATCSYRYNSGSYEMDNSRAETMAISYQEDNFSDCEASVSARSLGGADYVGFGLAGRFQLNGGAVSYYGLFVSQSGEFLLLKVLGGKEYVLSDWTPVAAPAAGEPWTISLEFVGPAIHARVNGELVASIKDGDIPAGGYALLAGPGTSASYDDFSIRGVRTQ